MNQCPHNLDMMQWLFGQPKRVRAFCNFGRYHDIEVEDDVTAYLEFSNGATGVFIGSTGEAPGTNRLEITGEFGRIVYENDEISFQKNAEKMTPFNRSSPEPFARPATTVLVSRMGDHGGQHVEVLQNFSDAIRLGSPLIAPAAEGIYSVELANAMLLSTWQERTVELPLCPAEFEAALNARIASSSYGRPSSTQESPKA